MIASDVPPPAPPPALHRSFDTSSLTVAGDGEIAVSTDDMAARSARLSAAADAADDWTAALSSALWTAESTGVAASEIGAARGRADGVADRARRLAATLDRAMEAYGALEAYSARVQEVAGGLLGWLGGYLSPLLLGVGLTVAVDATLAWFAVVGVRKAMGLQTELDPAALLAAHPRLLANPVTVGAVRVLMSSLDDVAAGMVRLPEPLARLLDDTGITGVRSSVLGALVLGGLFGVARETPVRVAQVDARGAAVVSVPRAIGAPGAAPSPVPVVSGVPTTAPTTVGELLERIPSGATAGPQVRVEGYGNGQWIVYMEGTTGWDLSGSDQPFDLVSDVHGLADAQPGSYRAVLDAMRQAGVREGDDVFAVGHSQGGMLAAMLARDADFHCTGIVTAGAPIADMPVPEGVPVLRLEHHDDLVPAVAGLDSGLGKGQLLVGRDYLAGVDAAGAPPQGVVAAHELTAYRETARLVDAVDDPRVQEFRARLAHASASAGEDGTGTATWWRGTRE